MTPAIRESNQAFRLAALGDSVDVDALFVVAGVAVDVVVGLVELGSVRAGVALTSPALEHKLKSAVFPIAVMDAEV